MQCVQMSCVGDRSSLQSMLLRWSYDELASQVPQFSIAGAETGEHPVAGKTRTSTGASGFPELQKVCITTFYSSFHNGAFQRILKDFGKLRVLDPCGCSKISPQGLSELPCTKMYLSNSSAHPPYSWCPAKNFRGGRRGFLGVRSGPHPPGPRGHTAGTI